MGERVIKDKFNIHETYRKMNITNPYRYSGGGGGGGVAYPDSSKMLYAFSFRQIRPEATYAVRQWNAAETAYQDVGFVDGEIDRAALTSFANGAATGFEWYDQISNTLKYEKSGTLGRITDASGNLFIYSKNRIYAEVGFWKILTPNFTSICHNFQVVRSAGPRFVMYECFTPSKYIGIGENNATSAATVSAGSPDYYINQTLVTNPATRDSLYDAVAQTHNQITTKNLAISGIARIQNGIATSYPPLKYIQEEIWGNDSMTDTDIAALEQDQTDYYI
jgi:hypothetical protein